MARWSSVTGPAGAFAFTGAAAIITGMSITRFWDGGPLLVIANAEINAGAGGATGTVVFAAIDGSAAGMGFRRDLGANEIFRAGPTALVNVTPGEHTIDLRVNGPAGAGNQIPATGSRLMVIELPPWDGEENLAF